MRGRGCECECGWRCEYGWRCDMRMGGVCMGKGASVS